MISQTLISSGLTDTVTALTGVLVAAFLVAYVRQHFSATQISTACGIATEAVNFATQAAKKLGVTQDLAKYNSALTKAKELSSKAGVNLSDSQWETLLESAYKKAKDGLQPLQTGTITSGDITDMIATEVGKIVPNVPVDTITGLIQQELSKLSLSVNVAPTPAPTPTPTQQVISPPQPAPVNDSPTEVAS
ncbi:MAG: phage holin, LLH family [Desulfosporosinus sp.]|nr:phage holin, LLH family [Desulfosporosinus sp.]